MLCVLLATVLSGLTFLKSFTVLETHFHPLIFLSAVIDLSTLLDPGTSDFSITADVYDAMNDRFIPVVSDLRITAADFPYELRGAAPGFYRYRVDAVLPSGIRTISSGVVDGVDGTVAAKAAPQILTLHNFHKEPLDVWIL